MSFYADGSVMGESVEVVTTKLKELKNLSDQYNSLLTQSLASIGQINIDDVDAPPKLMPPDIHVPSIDGLDDAPNYTPQTLTAPDMPVLANMDKLLNGLDDITLELTNLPSAPDELILDIPDIPTIANIKAPISPSFDMAVNLPLAPTLDTINTPTRPSVDMTLELPQVPDLTLPDMVKLFDIELPTWQDIELPTWQDGKELKALSFDDAWWSDDDHQYQSEVYNKLLATAKNMLDPNLIGNFGLPDAVVQVLFDKPRTRLARETKRAIGTAVSQWASRGFSLPAGVLQKQMDAIYDDEALKVSELNTDIFVQATKEQMEQLRFAVTQGLALEQHTFNIFDNMVKRLFDMARFNAEAQFKLFDYQISVFNAQNDSVRLMNDVYKTKLEAVLSKLTIYKAKLDAQTTIGQLNAQQLEVYKAKLQGVQMNTEVFKTLMSGVQTKIEIIKTQFDAYRTDLQAYSEQLNAQKMKFELYKTRLDGEGIKTDIAKTQAGIYATQMDAYKTAVDSENKKLDAYDSKVKATLGKVQIYDTQVKAYAERLRAYSQKGDLQLKQLQLKTDIAKTYTQKYLAEVDSYKANLQSNLTLAQNHTENFKAVVDAWQSKAQMKIAGLEMQSKWTDMQTRTNIAYSEMQMKEYEAKIRQAQAKAQIALESAKAIGGYAAQLASGAMSATHVSASISASGSASNSTSDSTSTSTSHNYTY